MQSPEEMRAEARRLVELAKRVSDQNRKERYAARAFALAQWAEELTRKD